MDKKIDRKSEEDLFYVCILIEYIARKTANRRKDVIKFLDKDDIRREMYLAEMNRELPFDQVAGALIEDYKIPRGRFDTIRECRYTIPSVISIGRLYQQLILAVCEEADVVDTLTSVFSSFISDEISNFNSDLYYRNPDYLKMSYLEGELLD